MTAQMADYKSRNIDEWLEMANEGTLALPDFQRSWVWSPSKIQLYLKALFENRPTGTFLILEAADDPQFGSRSFSGMPATTGRAKELVLDGQQRLTALWIALGGEKDPKHRFYLKVNSLKKGSLDVVDVQVHSTTTRPGRELEDPRVAYAEDLVPVGILYDAKDDRGLGEIWHWCNKACGNGSALDVQVLNEAIRKRLREPFLFNRPLWYCNLDKSTRANVAVDIFVETNSISVRIKRFDIVVALARGAYGEDLRDRIHDAFRDNEVMTHYFKPNQEEWIPDVGEWMLKVACLKAGLAPKEANYDDALRRLVEGGTFAVLDNLFQNLRDTLIVAAREGAPTRRTLPSWPPLHVIAALQDRLEAFRDPSRIRVRDKLIIAYYWRCLFSNRHQMQANDRLLEDYHDLVRCLDEVEEIGGIVGALPGVFNQDAHPIPTAEELAEELPWISRGRPGRALAALATRRTPSDWITGQKFDVERVRKMEANGKLDRHHVFPREMLRGEGIEKDSREHGLNGVLLDRRTNRRFSKSDPRDCFAGLLDDATEDELRARVASHLVPYDVIWSGSTVKGRYQAFIRARAKLVAKEIRRLVTL